MTVTFDAHTQKRAMDILRLKNIELVFKMVSLDAFVSYMVALDAAI